jgi:hypothetical protein
MANLGRWWKRRAIPSRCCSPSDSTSAQLSCQSSERERERERERESVCVSVSEKHTTHGTHLDGQIGISLAKMRQTDHGHQRINPEPRVRRVGNSLKSKLESTHKYRTNARAHTARSLLLEDLGVAEVGAHGVRDLVRETACHIVGPLRIIRLRRKRRCSRADPRHTYVWIPAHTHTNTHTHTHTHAHTRAHACTYAPGARGRGSGCGCRPR